MMLSASGSGGELGGATCGVVAGTTVARCAAAAGVTKRLRMSFRVATARFVQGEICNSGVKS